MLAAYADDIKKSQVRAPTRTQLHREKHIAANRRVQISAQDKYNGCKRFFQEFRILSEK